MKMFVNLIQLAVVAAIIYPIFYLWNTDKIEQFCKVIEPGMTKQAFIQLADDSSIKMLGPTDDDVAGGKWQATIVAYSPYTKYSCKVKGTGNSVAVATIIDD
ncbi:MAG: hypothetical protein DRQ35_04555 [Gammaproteobacteria bacterium]|nr:MAG: hypothetical protein DRQ35_04555 [Gammaproteobacteria bacterium]